MRSRPYRKRLRGPVFTTLMEEVEKGRPYVIVGIDEGRVIDYDFGLTKERAEALLFIFEKRYGEAHIYRLVKEK